MLSRGAIAGIVILVLLVLGGIVVGVLFALKVLPPGAPAAGDSTVVAPDSASTPDSTTPPAVPAVVTPPPAVVTPPPAVVTPPPPPPAVVTPPPPPPPPPAPLATMTAANGTVFVQTRSRICNMTTGPPLGGSTLQDLISSCATTTKLGGHSQCLGIVKFTDGMIQGCLGTAPAAQYGGPFPGQDTWIMQSEENLSA